MSQTLDDILEEVRSIVRDEFDELKDNRYYQDQLHEIADGCVPVYTYDLAQVGATDIKRLMLTKPECGPAFDGEPTPTNIIAANIYEAAYEAAEEEFQRLKEAAEEKELEGSATETV